MQETVRFQNVNIQDGFWSKRQKMVAEVSIYSIWKRFKETGRFDALLWKEGQPNRPHIFWDSDVAKWLEAVAYILIKKEDKTLEAAVDSMVELIEKYQDEDGYFNSYYLIVEPENRWKYRTEHELYCAGHLIEAAIAYYQATDKIKFLNLMKKLADHIERVFKIDQTAAFLTCGHEEIEMALVKLYQCTGDQRYLELSKFFIDQRGQNTKDTYQSWSNELYAQDHLPVRQQTTAEGHAVRATYLYSAMADLAKLYNETPLFDACQTIFKDIVNRKMYITGGIGSSSIGEAFTLPYDLPNMTAYTESCAAIGLAFFAQRMLQIKNDSSYADVIERVLYNGFLSSISLDGNSFFYENPLEVMPDLAVRDVSLVDGLKRKLPPTQRKEVFDCSCCPPNIARFLSSLGDYIYTYDENTLFIHQYMPNETCLSAGTITQNTSYPADGTIHLNIQSISFSRVALRIPQWCQQWRILKDNAAVEYEIENGYLLIQLTKNQPADLTLELEMPIQIVESSPRIQENSGRVAIQRGPVIYCLEAVDVGPLVRDIRLDLEAPMHIEQSEFFGLPVIKAKGHRRNTKRFQDAPYAFLKEEYEKVNLTFIPYFGFANRGESEMTVWVL